MQPVAIPSNEKVKYEYMEIFEIGPPPEVGPEDCGSVEALVGTLREQGVFDGAPVIRTYWKPSEQEVEVLLNGGVVELELLAPMMIPTSLHVASGE